MRYEERLKLVIQKFSLCNNLHERMICIKFTCSLRDLYTLAEGIMISVRSFQCSEGDVFDPIKYIYF